MNANDGKSNKPKQYQFDFSQPFCHARLISPNEQRTIERTNVADVFLGKVDIQLNQNNLLTFAA